MSSQQKNQNSLYRGIDCLLRRGLRAVPASQFTEEVALWWGYRFKPEPSVAPLRSGGRVYVDHEDYLQILIRYLGTFEPHCLPFLRTCAGVGGTVVDVGANIGFHTIESALAVGKDGRVISIEAAPEHIGSLKRNIELNNFRNVSVIESAVGDRAGQGLLKLSSGSNLGMFTLGDVEGTEVRPVAVDTIDNLLRPFDLGSVDLIKMDIEGSELKALLGSIQTLRKYHPVVLVELNDSALRQCGATTRQIMEFLRGMNYRGWRIGRNSVEILVEAALAGDECQESLFVHRNNDTLIKRLGLPL